MLTLIFSLGGVFSRGLDEIEVDLALRQRMPFLKRIVEDIFEIIDRKF